MSIDPESSFFNPPERAHGLVLVDPVAMPFAQTPQQPFSHPAIQRPSCTPYRPESQTVAWSDSDMQNPWQECR